MTRPAPKMRLADVARGPRMPETVAEWDVTPGLHEWIESEIKRREAEPPPHGQDCNALPTPQSCSCSSEDYCECADHNGFDSTNCDCPWPATVARGYAAARKILAAHPHTTRVINPGYGKRSAGFGCETCHDWDGVPEGRGNCVTILALAEAYGLEPAGDADVEVVRD